MLVERGNLAYLQPVKLAAIVNPFKINMRLEPAGDQARFGSNLFNQRKRD